MSRHSFGTGIRRDISAKLLGQAISAPGLDQRYWCSLATVCTVDPETGKKDPTDNHAIYNDSAGVDVDVELEPLGQPCTCKYAGESAGEVTVCTPIRPGDIVLVECPDGDLTTPVITHILHSRSKRQPTDGGKPIFDNNRMLVYAKTVPIDIRTAGGVRVLLDQDGKVTITAAEITGTADTVTVGKDGATVTAIGDKIQLGGTSAVEPLVLGRTRSTAETTFVTEATAALALLMTAASPTPPTNPLAPLSAGFTALNTAFAAFLGQLPTFLSQVSTTK
jgi:hypothetical protein